MLSSRLVLLFAGSVCALLLTGCGSDGGVNAAKSTELKGAGATFPELAYSKWISDYKHEHPTMNISYAPVGSTAGVQQLAEGKVDFAATDVPLSDAEMAKHPGKVLHFPTLVGAVVPIYNLPDVKGDVNFTADVLAGILLGKIRSWSDPAIKHINSKVELPSTAIRVVHRAPGSGTTYVLTDFLVKSSPAWKSKMGEGPTMKWPVGDEAASNEAVAEAVAKTPGSFGYVELNYAVRNKLAFGAVKNEAGDFVKATFESLGAATDSVKTMPADLRAMATNGPEKKAYPLANFTYLIVPTKIADSTKRDAMKKFLGWVYDKDAGQKSALALEYNILPLPVLDSARAQVDKIQ
ncbi:MAG: phosphate ABC transporter substrate-binding protein PstS [Bryobacteraceae bacterium]|nr:phosphate ABC transporter substrate-binding protein PstS [Bryobacteraceae bacterium]